jgi:DNA-binding transcriptional LysR family regulator
MTERDRWAGIGARHFEALKAVAEQRSFAAAGERLGYTQSAISQQIAALERSVGQRLVERPGGRRPVRLTRAGETLLRHAAAIADRMQAARADLDALAAGAAGSLSVGTFQSAAARLLPELLRRFGRKWPQVELTLSEDADADELVALVEAGRLDLAFALLPLEDRPLETVELLRDPYALVVSAQSPLAHGRSTATLDELAGLELITFRSCPNERRIEQHIHSQGLQPPIVFRTDDNGALQGLAAVGFAAALMPELSIDHNDPRTRVLSLGDAVPPRVVGLAWHAERYLTPPAEDLIALARQVCEQLAPTPPPQPSPNRPRLQAGPRKAAA